MRGFIARRCAQGIVVLFLVATITFLLIHLAPGDPFSATIDNPRISESVRAQWRAMYGYDRPLSEQYLLYLRNVARGDFGYSVSFQRPVRSVLAAAIPNTLLLMSLAIVASFAVGIALGVLQAMHRGGAIDRLGTATSLLFYSVPDYWLALMMLLVFSLWLALFPVGGATSELSEYHSMGWRVIDRLRHLVLPAATLTLLSSAGIARFQRAAMLDVLGDDYVRAARAKGASERSTVLRHALRNALLPVISLLGLSLPALLGGAVFVEKVFAWPGMGSVAVNAITSRDYQLVVATSIVGAALVVVGSALADLLAMRADPRLRETV